jgi:DNA-binding MarR family transcriptional regulator
VSRSTRDELVSEVEDQCRAYHVAVDQVDEAVAMCARVNRTDLRCLDILERRGPLSAGELASASGLTTGAVTTVLDRLETVGYARRERDLDDRRRVLVNVTDEVRAAARELYGPLAAAHAETYTDFSDDDLAVIRKFLRRSREVNERHAAWLRSQQVSQA